MEFFYNSTMHLTIGMFSFELAFWKEAKKTMDMAISMGRRDHFKEVEEMVRGCENYTQAKKWKWKEKHANKTQKHGIWSWATCDVEHQKFQDAWWTSHMFYY